MNKAIWAIVVAVVVIAGWYYMLPTYQSPAPVGQTAEQPAVAPQEAVSQNVVTYTDAGYSPSSITVKKGDVVIFKNDRKSSMWTASAMHPTHDVYPEKGGCIASTFDACKGYVTGESWSFTFNIPGTWKYHNHLVPTHFGSITVQE